MMPVAVYPGGVTVEFRTHLQKRSNGKIAQHRLPVDLVHLRPCVGAWVRGVT